MTKENDKSEFDCGFDVPDEPERPLTYAIEQRLRMLDFLLVCYGYVQREFLCDYFGVSAAQVSLDIKRYLKARPNNITYNLSVKRYEVTPAFVRLYS